MTVSEVVYRVVVDNFDTVPSLFEDFIDVLLVGVSESLMFAGLAVVGAISAFILLREM